MSDFETEGKLLSAETELSNLPPTPVDSGKTPDILAAEIRTIKAQTGRMVLNASIEVGRRLTEAKAQLPHGKWGEYLKQEVDYSPSQAQNLMRVFREYGNDQQSIFGGSAKSQTFGNLTYSKALSLLAIPDEDERERFAVENDVEHMSVRELNEALKAKSEAEAAAAAAKEEVNRLQDQLADYDAQLTSRGSEVTDANIRAQAAQEALEKANSKAQRLQDALSEANASAQAAEEEHSRLLQELEELRNRPVDVAVEVDSKAVEAAREAAVAEMTEKVNKAKADRKEADKARKTAEEALAAAQSELAELKAREPEVRELTQEEKDALTAEAVNQAKAEGAEQIRSLEKKLAAADPDVAEFKVRVDSWQKDYREIMKVLDRITQADVKQAARNLVKAALEQMRSGQGEQIT